MRRESSECDSSQSIQVIDYINLSLIISEADFWFLENF
jgi:hypothetical protein